MRKGKVALEGFVRFQGVLHIGFGGNTDSVWAVNFSDFKAKES
jgi:hypothetical protein